MDSRVKYGILIVVGGVGVYLIWKGGYFQQWFPSLFGPATPTPSTTPGTTGQTPAQIAAAAAAAKAASDAAAAAASGNAAALAAAQKAASDAAAAKAAADAAAAQQAAQNAAAAKAAVDLAAAAKAAAANQPATHTCPDIMTWNDAEGACVCPPGYLLGATTNTCVPQLISAQMVTAAGTSDGLSTDEWCFYYQKITGNDCPIDPGSIDPQVYHDAGVQLADGSPGDRSTPTSIQTWLAIMQNQAPSAGLSGLAGLAALRVANAWLV